MQTPSRYKPIWEKLKSPETNHKVSILSSPKLHKRIIKAVTRRKDDDLGYKLLCAEENKKARLLHKIEGNTVHFQLIFLPVYSSINSY